MLCRNENPKQKTAGGVSLLCPIVQVTPNKQKEKDSYGEEKPDHHPGTTTIKNLFCRYRTHYAILS